MRIHEFIVVNSAGDFAESETWDEVEAEVSEAIEAISWPPGTDEFVIQPTKHGNGVKPIKEAFQHVLEVTDRRIEVDWMFGIAVRECAAPNLELADHFGDAPDVLRRHLRLPGLRSRRPRYRSGVGWRDWRRCRRLTSARRASALKIGLPAAR